MSDSLRRRYRRVQLVVVVRLLFDAFIPSVGHFVVFNIYNEMADKHFLLIPTLLLATNLTPVFRLLRRVVGNIMVRKI